MPFDQTRGPIVVPAAIWGPRTGADALLLLDTGALSTVISIELVEHIGYDVAQAPQPVRIITASRVQRAHRVPVAKVMALGKERRDFPVIAHTLPPVARVDGVLGLDFFRGHRLIVDLREGWVRLD